MTIHEKITSMDKEDLASFLYTLYNKGWFDGTKREDDECWISSSILNDEDFDVFLIGLESNFPG